MKKIVILTIFTQFLNSCYFFGPIDSSIQTKNVEYKEKDIIGTWKLDKFSYKYLSKKENMDSIYIIFNADSTFNLNNSIALFNRQADLSRNEKINGKIDNLNTVGKWEIRRYKVTKHNELVLKFKDNNNTSGIDVFKKGNEYQIWYFFNDPDTGQSLRFIKK